MPRNLTLIKLTTYGSSKAHLNDFSLPHHHSPTTTATVSLRLFLSSSTPNSLVIIRRRRRSPRIVLLSSSSSRAMADDKTRTRTKPPNPTTTLDVYLYIPNIIGYIRILMNCFAFAICFRNKILFSFLYLISFVCDALDGYFARKFNQVSTFGAVLDMVTDRVSTACLLLILSQVYRPGLIFLSLLALDIGSHWFQMYSTFLLGKTSHKDVKDSNSWLFRAYYGNRIFMAYCCVSCEVLYIMLFLLAEKQVESLRLVLGNALRQSWITAGVLGLVGFGWAIKQLVNGIQMKTAADICVLHDINNKKQH